MQHRGLPRMLALGRGIRAAAPGSPAREARKLRERAANSAALERGAVNGHLGS